MNQELSTADFVAGAQRPSPPENVGGAKMVREEKPAPLFDEGETQDLRTRWNEIQTGFVDEPRKAVEQADSLVAQTMKRLAEIFAHERSALESQWDRGDNISTEDLRVALQRYRSFFNRLLAM
jgi:hypothetical protein